MPKDTYYRERARKPTKSEVQPKLPTSIICPKCGNHLLEVNINHARKYVTVACLCFGKLKLKYKGPASEPVDYLAELIDKKLDFDVHDKYAGHFAEEKTRSKSILIKKPKSGAIIVRKPKVVDIHPYVLCPELAEAVRQFILKNPYATDLQASAITKVPYSEVRRIRASIIEKIGIVSPKSNKNEEPPASSKASNSLLVQCPHCSSKVRKDRLSRHINKAHHARLTS